MSKIVLQSLNSLSVDEANAYLEEACGDEYTAAYQLAMDRNLLDGATTDPDDTEVHHALFLLRRVRGAEAPSFDTFASSGDVASPPERSG